MCNEPPNKEDLGRGPQTPFHATATAVILSHTAIAPDAKVRS